MEASRTQPPKRSMLCRNCIADFQAHPGTPCPDCGHETEPLLGACDTCGAETDDADIRTCGDCGAYEDAEERAFELHRERDW